MQNCSWAENKICKLFYSQDYHYHVWNIYYANKEIVNNWKTIGNNGTNCYYNYECNIIYPLLIEIIDFHLA